MEYIYKIRTKDGLFSVGQSKPRFSEHGKCWTSMKFLRAHLRIVENVTPKGSPDYPYKNCSVVRFKLEEDEVLETFK